MRVAQLWHYVLISRVLAFLTFAFLPGVAGFLDHPSQWLVMAQGLPWRPSVLTVVGRRCAARAVCRSTGCECW